MQPTILGNVWAQAHQCQTRELDQLLEVEHGVLPADLRGVLYRIGPGRFERGGRRYAHPFDGDGMVARFGFTNDGVVYRNRFVRTREYAAEEKANQFLYRSFGTNLPGGITRNALRANFKNTANTNIIHHAGRLLALWEGGLPHLLEPSTLETLGRHHFDGGLLAPRSPLSSLMGRELPFSAHPKTDPSTGQLYNFGTLMHYRPQLLVYRCSVTGAFAEPVSVPLDHLNFVHDFGLTANFCVFMLAPTAFRVASMVLGLGAPMSSFTINGAKAGAVMLVPRKGQGVRKIPMKSGFVFHIANTYEANTEQIVLEGTRWTELPQFTDLRDLRGNSVYRGSPPALTRFTIDLRRNRVSEERICEYSLEFPVINPRCATSEHTFVWGTGAGPTFNEPGTAAVIKTDTRSGKTLIHEFAPDLPSEGIFVQRPGATREDDGWLLLTLYLSVHHRTDLIVLDASDLSLVYRARLPHHLPPGFHGTWVGEPAATRTQ